MRSLVAQIYMCLSSLGRAHKPHINDFQTKLMEKRLLAAATVARIESDESESTQWKHTHYISTLNN